MSKKKKIIRITTVPISLRLLLKGQLKYISSYFDVIAVSSGGIHLELLEIEQEIKTIPVEMSRKITPIKDLISILKMYCIIRKEKPYIVHTHTPKAGFVGMTAAIIAGVPHKLHTVAGLPLMEAKGIKRIILDMIEKITYLFADRIYPNSIGLKEFILKKNLCKENKLRIIGFGSSNGVDTNYFSRSEELVEKAACLKYDMNIRENDFVFCFIGRLVKDKGINELVRAFADLNKLTKNIKLVLIGDFEEELDPLSDSAKTVISKSKNIIHCGWQDDVRPYLILSDVLVFPSYREGFPNVPMQAGSLGIPCIVTNINGCNEIIKNEQNGLLIEPKNVEQLKNAMYRLLDEKELRENLSQNARKMIVERYEQSHIWNEILKEYQSFDNNYTSINEAESVKVIS